jgi:hypothetical protein
MIASRQIQVVSRRLKAGVFGALLQNVQDEYVRALKAQRLIN